MYPANTLQAVSRVYKEGEGECRTAYMLRITAVCTVHDLCNDNSCVEVTLECTSTHAAHTSTTMVLAGLGCNVYVLG